MDEVYIRPESNKLTMAPAIFDEDLFKKIDAIAFSVCSNLQHTPIAAIGYNYRYELDEDEKVVVDINTCEGDCKSLYSEIGGSIQSKTTLMHSIAFEEKNLVLNISYEVTEENKFMLNLNYHYQVDRDKEKVVNALNKCAENYVEAQAVKDILIKQRV